MRLRAAILAPLVVLGLAAGCGGSDDKGAPAADGSGTPTSTASTPAGTASGTPSPAPVIEKPASAASAVAATRTYLEAFIAGDARTVCSLESDAFIRQQIDRAATAGFVKKDATCIQFVEKVVKTSNSANATPSATPAYEITALEATATRAKVRVTYPQNTTAVPDTYVLVRDGGRWLIASNPN